VGARDAVDVSVDDHVVVEPEDRVVERGRVEPELDPGRAEQRPIRDEAVADAGAQDTVPELLLGTAAFGGLGLRVAEVDPHGWTNSVARAIGARTTMTATTGSPAPSCPPASGPCWPDTLRNDSGPLRMIRRRACELGEQRWSE